MEKFWFVSKLADEAHDAMFLIRNKGLKGPDTILH